MIMKRLLELTRGRMSLRQTFRYLVLLAGMVLIFGIFQNMYLLPKQKKIDETKGRVNRLASEINSLSDRVSSKKERARQEAKILKAYREMSEKLEGAKRMLPTRENMSVLLEELTTPGRETGISVLSLLPFPPEDTPRLTRFSFKLQLNGRYRNIGKYLVAIENLDRLVIVDNVQITGGDGSDNSVQTQVLASTYLMKEGK